MSFKTVSAAILATLGITSLSTTTNAAEVVAIGASQTYGHGVSRGQDYPSQLQAMLAAKGLHVSVLNAGNYSGETTAAMLSRIDGVLSTDTKVVIFQPGRARDSDTNRSDNVASIKKKLAARHIAFIKIPNNWFKDFPRSADGQHLTAEGYRGLAARLLPTVMASLKGRR